MTIKTWKPNIGPIVIWSEVKNTKVMTYIRCFAFNLKEVNRLKEEEVHIIFADDNSISKQPYKFIEVERALV
jgi:hypothetical protein